jgi:ankyrin repeat domain-containing protein 50
LPYPTAISSVGGADSTRNSSSVLPDSASTNQSGRSPSEAAPEDRAEKYGLFALNQSPSADSRDPSKQRYDVDLVAVHGLNGDAYHTWTHDDSGKFWLRDFLPGDLPGARIFSFGYPSEIALSLSVGKLEDFSRALLEDLKSVRVDDAV